MTSLFSQEEVTKRYGYERFLEGENQGMKKGMSKASENIAVKLLKGNMDAAQVATVTELPLSRIRELSKTL